MPVDRSKFKPTLVATLQKENEMAESNKQSKKTDRVEMLKIKEGSNAFRIYPAHPTENEDDNQSIINLVKYWIPMMQDERDERGQIKIGNNGKPLRSERAKQIWDARTHGWDTVNDKPIKTDLVDEYIKFAKKLADTKFTSKEDKDNFLLPIYGGGFKSKEQGIVAKNSWTFYADQYVGEQKTFGRLEFSSKAVFNGITKAAEQESSNQPIQTSYDCFTNPDTGRLLKIYYDKNNDDPKLIYSVSIDTSQKSIMVNGKPLRSLVDFPLTDEELDYFVDKVTPLSKQFRKVFKLADLQLQIDALQFFDEKHNFGIISDDKFLDIMDEMMLFWEERETASGVDPTEGMSTIDLVNYKNSKKVEPTKATTKKTVVAPVVVEKEEEEETEEDSDLDSPDGELEEEAKTSVVEKPVSDRMAAIKARRTSNNS